MIIVVIVFLLVAGITFRLMPLRLWRLDPSDAWSHIYYSRFISPDVGSRPTHLPNVFPHTELTYPWGIAWLISRYQISNPLKVGTKVNLVISIFEFCFAGVAAYFLAAELRADSNPLYAAALALAIFAFLPQMNSTWSGIYGVNGRPLGSFVVNLAALLLPLGFFVDPRFYVPLLPVCGLLIYFSKFGMQALIAMCLVLSIVWGSGLPMMLFAIGMLLIFLIRPNSVIKIIRGHLFHSKFYAEWLQFKHTGTTHRCLTLFQWFSRLCKKPSIKNLMQVSYWCPPVRLLLLNPWILLVFVLAVNDYNSYSQVERAYLLLVILGFSLALIVSISFLRFLGEADRYFTFFSTMPLAMILALNVQSTLELVLFICVLVICVVNSIVLMRERSKVKADTEFLQEKELGDFFRNGELQRGRCLAVPTNLTQKLIMFLDTEFVGIFLNAPLSVSGRELLSRLYTRNYPYPDMELAKLKNTYGVKYLIYAKKYISPQYLQRHFIPQDLVVLPQSTPIFENEDYVVYTV